ncbi:low affinity iron permease family protein [Catellatospora sp. NPDC049609]|uniref:low affinity iron permease family protein n=1 Tax=Catellatospora sp. NPDC049609 TaxID=3155505 RepID=UPI003443CA62
MTGRKEDMPSSVSGKDMSVFDHFAEAASTFASKAWFFAMCVLLILIWAPSIAIIGDVDTWQLIINTATTIVTFLMVALLQNSQTRANEAVQHKLNAIADGLADLMEAQSDQSPGLAQDMVELRDAVGLEHREGTSH